MDNRFNRTEMVIGPENMKKLQEMSVIVFGLGGVGGSLCEALVRSGLGNIAIVDGDKVDVTNINRQVIATEDTVGMKKTEACCKRLKAINPEVNVETFDVFLDKDTISDFDLKKYDFCADAIDTVTSKILLAQHCKEAGTEIIMSMGMGNKIDPSMIEITDIKKTSVCPLARVMRREFKKRNIENITVAYSKEEARKPYFTLESERTPGSVSFVPPVCGMIMAGYIIRKLINI